MAQGERFGMAALFVSQWSWLGPIVIIDETDPTPPRERGHRRPVNAARIRVAVRRPAHG
ncbi:MAG: hypothetical protein JWL96_2178 [Sphingomonas bacterium]|nr:hypothetical protein [Sphingomonas bacterium]